MTKHSPPQDYIPKTKLPIGLTPAININLSDINALEFCPKISIE